MNSNIPAKLKITRSLPKKKYREVLEILYDAFFKKIKYLELMPKSKEQALRVMETMINFNSCFYALWDKKVVAVAGIKTAKTHYLKFNWSIMIKEFCILGALYRFLIYLIEDAGSIKKDCLSIETLAVDSSVRGKKIGTTLLQYIFRFAKNNGYKYITLEVINTNQKAKRLYERLKFQRVKTYRLGFLTKRAGFTAVFCMKRNVE